MRNVSRIAKISLGLVIGSALAAGSLAIADTKPSTEVIGGCNCLDVWIPVICNNGVVYSNACYARCAKAKGCVPYGGDSIKN